MAEDYPPEPKTSWYEIIPAEAHLPAAVILGIASITLLYLVALFAALLWHINIWEVGRMAVAESRMEGPVKWTLIHQMGLASLAIVFSVWSFKAAMLARKCATRASKSIHDHD